MPRSPERALPSGDEWSCGSVGGPTTSVGDPPANLRLLDRTREGITRSIVFLLIVLFCGETPIWVSNRLCASCDNPSTCLLSYRCIVYCTIDVLGEIQNPNKMKIDGYNKRAIEEIASYLILIDFLLSDMRFGLPVNCIWHLHCSLAERLLSDDLFHLQLVAIRKQLVEGQVRTPASSVD